MNSINAKRMLVVVAGVVGLAGAALGIMNLLNAKRMLLGLAGAVGLAGAAQAADISGAGATFPYPVYSKWADAYRQKTGIGLNYQSIGSGGGIRQIKAKTVTFGASDMPLKPEELQEAGLVQFPMIIGGVVPVVNVKGVQGGQLVLDGATVAAIYLGDITRWNDARIRKLNPKLPLHSGVPLRWLRDQLPVLRLPVEVEPEVPAERGGQHLGAMAGGHRRQG